MQSLLLHFLWIDNLSSGMKDRRNSRYTNLMHLVYQQVLSIRSCYRKGAVKRIIIILEIRNQIY